MERSEGVGSDPRLIFVLVFLRLIEFGSGAYVCSEREYLKGDEIAWYADGDKIVRNEYNPATAYGFGTHFLI